MKKITALFACFAMLLINNVKAQSTTQDSKQEILDEISSAIGQAALMNVKKAEQVFCYHVAERPDNYVGYTLDGMAIVGFCGVVSDELKNMVITELFSNQERVLFDVTENCVIRPQIMLRFVRGVDYTDVLFSSPCHAFAFFYGGKVSAFNAKPAAPIVDALVKPLTQNKIDFASPALLKQLLPIGIAQTDDQKEILEQQNAPIRKWVENKAAQEAKNAPKGWNKLNRSRRK